MFCVTANSGEYGTHKERLLGFPMRGVRLERMGHKSRGVIIVTVQWSAQFERVCNEQRDRRGPRTSLIEPSARRFFMQNLLAPCYIKLNLIDSSVCSIGELLKNISCSKSVGDLIFHFANYEQ